MLALFLGSFPVMAGESTNKPAVLFVTHWGRANGANEAYLKRLLDAGMTVSSAKMDKVTPELLSKFDVVVIPALPPVGNEFSK